MTKVSKNLSKPRGIGHPFDFTSFSARPVLVLGRPFYSPRVFLIRFHFFYPLGLGLDSSMTLILTLNHHFKALTCK